MEDVKEQMQSPNRRTTYVLVPVEVELHNVTNRILRIVKPTDKVVEDSCYAMGFSFASINLALGWLRALDTFFTLKYPPYAVLFKHSKPEEKRELPNYAPRG